MKVGFFVPKTGLMVEVEDVDFSDELVTLTGMQLSSMWQTGRHKMPSHIWCAWEGQDGFRLFMLDGSSTVDTATADRAFRASSYWPAY